MMFDTVPFENPKCIIPKSGHDTSAPTGKYMVRLLEDHPKMKSVWLVLPDAIFEEADIEGPLGERRWWRVHGRRRILKNASKEYLHWLQNLEQDKLVYGYEKQVRLGNHGYHHTPPFEPYDSEGYGEFQYYDPAGHDSTFKVIREEYTLLGLTEKSLRIFRAPSFKCTQSTIDALIKYGFKVIDLVGYSIQPFLHPNIYVFHNPYGRLWGINMMWSGDVLNQQKI